MEVEEEVTNLKAEVAELKALKADVEAMKAMKAMKAWPVNPFVPTSFGFIFRKFGVFVMKFHWCCHQLTYPYLSQAMKAPKAMKATKVPRHSACVCLWHSGVCIFVGLPARVLGFPDLSATLSLQRSLGQQSLDCILQLKIGST